ncbi:MAG TPA: hypothetical protein VJ922_09085 [Actinomycetota bacterium]|nr:hypothetical protein [Actinomycetota bacterium]
MPAMLSTYVTALRSAGAGPDPFGFADGCDELDGAGLGFGFGFGDADCEGDGEGVGVAWQSPSSFGAKQ